MLLVAVCSVGPSVGSTTMRFVVPELATKGISSTLNSIETAYWKQKEAIEGVWSPSGLHYQANTSRKSGGNRISAQTIQRECMNRAFELLGSDFWKFGLKSKHRIQNVREILEEVRTACGYHRLKYRTFRRWMTHYIQYGETPAMTGRRPRRTRQSSFSRGDDKALKDIIRDSPQLYLDEIADLLYHQSGKRWSDSTIWRRMQFLGYSLQVAIFRARQISENEQLDFRARLEDNVKDLEQILIIDEAHKSKNASRRRRAWGLKGLTPVLPAYFEEDFRKRYTLIGAANISGFIKEACEIVERTAVSKERVVVCYFD